jgi:anti-sigma factor RsiW
MSDVFHRVRFERDHHWAPGRMSAYLDGELSSRQRRRMRRHIDECVQCRRLLAGLRRMLGALASLPGPADGDPARIAASVRLRLDEPSGDE